MLKKVYYIHYLCMVYKMIVLTNNSVIDIKALGYTQQNKITFCTLFSGFIACASVHEHPHLAMYRHLLAIMLYVYSCIALTDI